MTMRSSIQLALLILLALASASCSGLRRGSSLDLGVECTSLLGIPLERPQLSGERQAVLEADLRVATQRHAAAPDDEDAAIWHGRRLAYLGRYRDAIAIYSEALRQHPESFRLLRHRGHRFITLRDFSAAVEDLERAAALARGVPDRYEEDGAPNAHGVPRSTMQSNIYYHLGLAEYLRGEYEAARVAWQRCLFFSRVNDDMLVATLYWNVLVCWKLGLTQEARALLEDVQPEMHILENEDYHRLLLFFQSGKGEAKLQAELTGADLASSTLAYGLGAWHLSHDADLQAYQAFQAALGGEVWAAFGYIAAEVELARGRPDGR